jgi:acetylornithine/succinyldiaminopimelate/putrescine aminotransferase
VALAVLRTIGDPAFLAEVRRTGAWLGDRLRQLAERHARVREVRGRGLLWGIELDEPAGPFITAARERGVLVVGAGPTVIRVVPPLVITIPELERGIGVLEEVLA